MEEQNIDTLLLNILMNVADEEETEFFSTWVKDKKNSDYFEQVKKTWNLFELKSSAIAVNETGRKEYINRIRKTKSRFKLIVLTSVSVAASLIAISMLIMETKKEITPLNKSEIVAENSQSNNIQPIDENISIVTTSSQGEVLKVTKLPTETQRISSHDLTEIVSDDSSDVQINTLVVPKGKRIVMTLPDGTTMWVNCESKVTYPTVFPKDKRTLDVVGNVFFEVAKDSTRPFEVNTNGIKTTALGTQFEVSNYEGQLCSISLLEGKVSVENSREKIIITPSKQIIANGATNNLTKRNFNVRNFGLWRNNVLVIDNEPISSVIKKLNRWHNVEIVNRTTGVEKVNFTGKLDDGTIEEHLKIITENIKVQFAKEGDRIIIWN